MAIAPKLQIRQGQSLVMTPQLQQAIKLLQLSNIELTAFVEEQLEQNPLLERGTGDENRREEAGEQGQNDDSFTEVDLGAVAGEASANFDAPNHAINSEASPADVGGSVDWSAARTGGSFSTGGDYDPLANTAKEKSLREFLSEQLTLAGLDDSDRLIAAYMIDHIDENGYMRLSTEEAAQRLGAKQTRVQKVLTHLQDFEPVGVFARSLRECLAIQLRERGKLDGPMEILLDNLPLLAKHDMKALRKLCDLDKEGLAQKITELKSLAPKPGLAFGGDVAPAVSPDVMIRETAQGGWAVELNSDTLPRVLVNHRYFAEICKGGTDEQTRTFMTECQQNASWLVKSLDQRARTILKVASEIVRQQDGFFAYGIDHMRPLNLKTVAEAIEMHESTISRVTSGKFMYTPRGLFEFKYFFSASIASVDGEEGVSSEAVRHKIKILISEETAKTVKSDDKLVKMLRAQGIDVARRTVAKYREAMGIPSSVERRRILKHSAQ